MNKNLFKVFSLITILAMMLMALPIQSAQALSADIVISQVYGGGGNSGAVYTHDFVELFNRGTSTVSLAGWSIQYTSATGTGLFGSATNLITPLSGSLGPGQYLLVQEATNAAVGSPLPTPDITDSTPINMSGTGGKVALVTSTTGLGCNGGSTPCSPAQLALVKDLVGWDGANFYETAPAPATANATASLRLANGCTETDNNSLDFATSAPTPRNTASPLNPCSVPQPTVINEVLASTTGTDVEYIELYGEPGASLAGLSLIYVESNDAAALGAIDFRYDFATTDAIGLNGFYLIGTTASLQSVYGVTPNATIATNSLENSSATVALVETASLSGGSVGGSEVVLDTVGITDATASTFFFGAPVIGPDGSFFPAGVRRVTDGVDTDTAADWVISDFNLGPANTPTAGTLADVAPTVVETNPADGATNVPVGGNVTVTFTESVDVAAGAISLECPAGTQVASSDAASDVTSVTLDPASDLPATTTCTITITPSGVTDNDGTPDALTGTTSFSFTTGAGTAITPIHAIQGSGPNVIPGTYTVEAIVVGDYQTQGSGQLRGFFIQEEDVDVDADPATSEGIFVFCSSCPTAVSVGDKVRVTGSASEFFDMSQLTATTAASVTLVSSSNPLPTPASIQLPVPGVPTSDLAAATTAINAYFEPFEGMLVTFPDTLSVSEYFELARFGQVILSEGGRPRQFTDANTPTAAGYINHQIDLATRTIILDDTDNRQNRPVDTPNTAYYHPVPGLSISNFFRGGDTITNLTGVLHWSFNGLSGEDAWRIRPVTEAYSYAFTPVNARPAVPEVGGSLKVASFNVLNYFLTIDTTASNDVGTCGPSGTQDCRGADSAQELQRQRTKMLAALSAIDADVFGFMEMENTPNVEPLADIVAGLPGYDYIDTGVIGGDAIRVGIIYKSTTVQPVGNYAILDSSVDPRFIDTRNRPALAQTFEEIATGARFTVVVNHLKSKGSGCGSGDDDTTTGQGNCNGTRTLAAQALADWLATDPTGSGDSDVLIIGDMNSYAKEDPIVALQTAGYTDMVAAFGGPNAYGYVFDGQLGYLDHALANASLNPQVVGVAEWHINADENPLFDYNDDVKDTGEATFEEESDVLPLYEANEFRTSDHDPVIIGLNPNAPPTVDAGGPYSVDEGSSVTLTASGSDPNGDTLTYVWDLDNNGSFETSGQSVSFDASLLDGPSGPYTVTVRATDPGGLTATDTATVDVLNADPTVSADPASQSVQYSDPIADVTITGVDASADISSLTISASWNVDGGPSFPGLPNGLAIYTETCGSNTCTWTLKGTALLAPGTYVVRVTVADKDGGSSTTDITITVTQEDARATYTGALYVSTSSTSSSNANVTLAATVQDISVTPNAGNDTYPGDIRNATVTFIDRDTNTPIAGCTDLPVGLVNPGDLQTGTATCNWSVTISGDAQDFTIGIVVNNYYTRNASDDDVIVMVAKPLASNFISGGGYIMLSDSAGQIAGDAGRKSNFGFNVKYNKSGKNLQGHVNIIVRRLEADGIVHVYQIKGNVMSSLAVQVNLGTATFNGKANIQDITDPLNPITIDGNATLQIDIDDNGEPGSGDTIGITLWNKNGGLWFASNWDGTQTVQQTLNGGNLVVR